MSKERGITCADRALNAFNEANCKSASRKQGKAVRCIDIPANVCRMKPVDMRTGRKQKRRFVFEKEGVNEKW